ncbi:hypothetical protein SDC9_173523 [bioreactor metagenome]|uniref:DUF6794 domain-containing protein n=1 Tax=bioreactor metagenome TaxID=1076179 RepID=A0A645GJT7_9ZZZZ
MRYNQRIALLLTVLWLCCSSLVVADETEVLGPGKWPETVDAAVQMIISRLPEKDQALIKGTKKEDLIQYHHGWGTGIRNYYGLWRGNRKLLLSACDEKPCLPDDASTKIIEAVWERLQK